MYKYIAGVIYRIPKMPSTQAYLKILESFDVYQPHKHVNHLQIVKVHDFPFTASLYVNGVWLYTQVFYPEAHTGMHTSIFTNLGQ